MKTVPLFDVLYLTQDTDKGAMIADSLIQNQIVKGLDALERDLLNDFARSRGCFSAEDRRVWCQGQDAEAIRERIHYYLRQMAGEL